ncbi:MAG: hypothetical protein P1U87_17280 [Verrucomicrobiales bacterium]|nr:hypothetical protein [Verrucomicrobiales bacterium]
MKSISFAVACCLFTFAFSSCGPDEEPTAPAKSDPAPEKPVTVKPATEKPKGQKPTPEKSMKNASDPESDQTFIGLPLKEAEEKAEKSGLRHRVVLVDGQPRPATRDYRPDRVNFEVENGKIVKVSRG